MYLSSITHGIHVECNSIETVMQGQLELGALWMSTTEIDGQVYVSTTEIDGQVYVSTTEIDGQVCVNNGDRRASMCQQGR